MQPDTDLYKIVILTQNNNHMLLIEVPIVGYVHVMVKLTMYLVSLAPRANNYLIHIIAQNNFAQVETCIEGTYSRRQSQRYHILKKPRSLTLFLDSFVPSAL